MNNLRDSICRVQHGACLSKLLAILFIISMMVLQTQGGFTMAPGSLGTIDEGVKVCIDNGPDHPYDGTCYSIEDFNGDTTNFRTMKQAPPGEFSQRSLWFSHLHTILLFPIYDDEVAVVIDEFLDPINMAKLDECQQAHDQGDARGDNAFAKLESLLAKRGVKEVGYGGTGSVNAGAKIETIGQGGEWVRLGELPDKHEPFIFSGPLRLGASKYRRSPGSNKCRWDYEKCWKADPERCSWDYIYTTPAAAPTITKNM
ncbi:uncharacterized protein RAG0_10867 [Rhynchosporium agropyri]|uniref:Uncharacterized protein n=1 Tax=Rhynchosporium agropyri TaxID=914238 RepID=A0A1E1L459_9HELO|nr:uncharacterized protein RAG0_10867 [Rhynchosporium agropyri]